MVDRVRPRSIEIGQGGVKSEIASAKVCILIKNPSNPSKGTSRTQVLNLIKDLAYVVKANRLISSLKLYFIKSLQPFTTAPTAAKQATKVLFSKMGPAVIPAATVSEAKTLNKAL